jgi:hypothetical protein
VTLAAVGLLVLALLGPPQAHPYYWRDAAGQTHITTTPPPSDAEILEAPQGSGVEPEKAGRSAPNRPGAGKAGRRHAVLSPIQRQAWTALDQKLAQARAAGDRQTLEAVADSLINNSLYGDGLWARPVVPIVSIVLMGLLGWWLALGLRSGPRTPLVAGFILLGLATGHLLLNVFLYHPQAQRLQQNLELLEHHMGTGTELRNEQRAQLQQRYLALEQAAEPLQAPWRFPAEVRALRETIKRVMVEP